MSDTKQSRIRHKNRLAGVAQVRANSTSDPGWRAEILVDAPFRDLTVAELMSLTGTSRSAFHQYFTDVHDLMETLLYGIQDDIFGVAHPWFEGEGDPIPLLQQTMAGLVKVCYQRGPILHAVSDTAPMDERLELAWMKFLESFDDAVADRIER